MEGKVTFFASFYETMKKLPTAEDRDRFAMGLLGYAFEGQEPDFSDNLALDLAFTNARPNLDASAKKARTARENGGSGGRPETNAKTDTETNAKTDRKTNRKTNAKTKQKTQPLLEKEKEKEREWEKEMEVEPSLSLEKAKVSTDTADGAGCGRAAPPDGVVPTCPKCGNTVMPTIQGLFGCMRCGAILGKEEVDWR